MPLNSDAFSFTKSVIATEPFLICIVQQKVVFVKTRAHFVIFIRLIGMEIENKKQISFFKHNNFVFIVCFGHKLMRSSQNVILFTSFIHLSVKSQ